MWARIENGIVAELISIDPAGRFHPSLVWVPCPAGTAVGYLYDSKTGTFSAPPAPAPIPLKQQAANALPETDMVCLRCVKAGVAFPAAWQTYTIGLRNIANGTDTTSTALPTKPAYPAGT